MTGSEVVLGQVIPSCSSIPSVLVLCLVLGWVIEDSGRCIKT